MPHPHSGPERPHWPVPQAMLREPDSEKSWSILGPLDSLPVPWPASGVRNLSEPQFTIPVVPVMLERMDTRCLKSLCKLQSGVPVGQYFMLFHSSPWKKLKRFFYISDHSVPRASLCLQYSLRSSPGSTRASPDTLPPPSEASGIF